MAGLYPTFREEEARHLLQPTLFTKGADAAFPAAASERTSRTAPPVLHRTSSQGARQSRRKASAVPLSRREPAALQEKGGGRKTVPQGRELNVSKTRTERGFDLQTARWTLGSDAESRMERRPAAPKEFLRRDPCRGSGAANRSAARARPRAAGCCRTADDRPVSGPLAGAFAETECWPRS